MGPAQEKSQWGILAILALLAAFALPTPAASAAPSCTEGPQIIGDTYYGTPCPDTIRAPRSVTTIKGEGGNDTLYGQRGNDSVFGGEGDDRLYGGVGDDRLRGGPGHDLLSGGFGADNLDGEEGGDFVRGDATIDVIDDSGGNGTDSLSYATGVAPGFENNSSFFDYTGFPPYDPAEPGRGRGVFIDLEDNSAEDGNGFANDGRAPAGGGVDVDLEGTQFERVIGTPFPDFILGSAGSEEIYGGGGADVLRGEGGVDQIHGGEEGDSCDADPGSTVECERNDAVVEPRAASTVAVGRMTPAGVGPPALYLTGSSGNDDLVATYSAKQPQAVFTVNGNPVGTISLSEPPDSLLLAGLDGNDSLTTASFPATTSVILLGGRGDDHLNSGATEDALVDGPGDDEADAAAGDDAVPNNAGTDTLHAGPGEDLFVSDAVCEGDTLDGGPDRDNANWANFGQAISIDMAIGQAGLVGSSGQPACASGSPTNLANVEDVEGSNHDDILVGDSGPNQLLGRPGHDSYHAAAGDDSILANSGDTDLVIDCGSGWATALIDIPTHTATDDYEDPPPSGCEDVEERPENSFRPPGTPPNPNPEPESPLAETSSSTQPPPRRVGDRTAPQTRLVHTPTRLVLTRTKWRKVAFALGSNEASSRFRCKIDRGPFRPCRSPRSYRVRLGRHAFRAFAIDKAGNHDRSPVVFKFAVHRLNVHSSQSHRRPGSTR